VTPGRAADRLAAAVERAGEPGFLRGFAAAPRS
jgi:hypothetical protein